MSGSLDNPEKLDEKLWGPEPTLEEIHEIDLETNSLLLAQLQTVLSGTAYPDLTAYNRNVESADVWMAARQGDIVAIMIEHDSSMFIPTWQFDDTLPGLALNPHIAQLWEAWKVRGQVMNPVGFCIFVAHHPYDIYDKTPLEIITDDPATAVMNELIDFADRHGLNPV